ncbi:2Fe-2S iron-sulfur cluster protein [Herbaspirillum sp. SJZ107]|nr:2Fe-2S iron-sulfur cluster protein [Herbaspirillum sp. SJZ107]
MVATGRRSIPVGCRGGGCGICKISVISGHYIAAKMSRACISEEEERNGTVLACRITPVTDLSIRVIGKLARCLSR